MIERYRDGNGLAFADARKLLPKRASDFPKVGIVKDMAVLEAIGNAWPWCMICGRQPPDVWQLHRHHIMHGSGRSDELTNLIICCSDGPDQGCHSEAHGGVLRLGVILWAKWRLDRKNVDWLRLAILYGRFLPDLLPDAEIAERYREAHRHIASNWDDLASGAVIDCEYLRGESDAPKISERLI
jgi:hypothetical protein